MSDPLALLPFAVAAADGTLDGVRASQWVAAGHTLLMRSAPLVRALAAQRSGILLPPGGAYLTALAASDGRGAVLLNPLASTPEIAHQLADAGIAVVLTNSALAATLPPDTSYVLLDDAPRTARIVIGERTQDVDLGSHFGIELSGSTDTPGREEDAVVLYTSAMAGTPLGARLTHHNLITNARAAAAAFADAPSDHSLVALPFAHLFGLIVGTCAPLLAGGRVTTMQRFHPGRALELFEHAGITRFMGVPSMFAALLHVFAQQGLRHFRSHKLRVCFAGGAVVPEALQDAWFDATGVELRQGYGLTEASPAVLLTRADAVNERGTMGTPITGTEVSIRDANSGSILGTEQVGEICVRGSNVFVGYIGGGHEGLQVRNGWLHTGDLGVVHASGTVSFRGLIKPMFTRNGFNIYPREIESVLLRMPGVHGVRVWGIPDAAKEHTIAARVSGAITAGDVLRWARAELASYKTPGHVEIDPAGE